MPYIGMIATHETSRTERELRRQLVLAIIVIIMINTTHSCLAGGQD